MTHHRLPFHARTAEYRRCLYFMQQGYTKSEAIEQVRQEIADGTLEKRKQGTPVWLKLMEIARMRGKA